ncbi:hypothetical protein ACFL4N_05145 [Thermodesulfobacteriota bacterium]
METFTEPKKLLENPRYKDQRRENLACLSDDMVDVPIIELITGFNRIPHCFTLQSCYGHFIYNGQTDLHNCEPLPITDTISRVEYRIAYIAFCIENSVAGRRMIRAMRKITAIATENIQFCSAEWFWERQINSYALQVEPNRFKHKDRAILGYKESLQIEKIRNAFFARLEEILMNEMGR